MHLSCRSVPAFPLRISFTIAIAIRPLFCCLPRTGLERSSFPQPALSVAREFSNAVAQAATSINYTSIHRSVSSPESTAAAIALLYIYILKSVRAFSASIVHFFHYRLLALLSHFLASSSFYAGSSFLPSPLFIPFAAA
ncbi:hypothetical protein C8R43DRAFT_1121706 [Mycena crocata]|nr:hypothetical protein C8R43DRAFT_1121706 [Mycena crocata]